MTAYLDEHPPRVRQFRDRGTTASGVIVIHTAESAPDTTGMDLGAEGVARFIQQRTTYGSYHWLADSDTLINVVRMDQQAYGDGTGSNPHAIHISAATQAARWPTLPEAWVEATVVNMARAAARADAYVHSLHGVHIPARRITRAESDRRVEGFISHGERDPGRRTDPGPAFPWKLFLDSYEELVFGDPKPTRGARVDEALRKVSAAIAALDEADPSDGPRGAKITKAETGLRAVRRDLRSIAYLNDEATS